MSELVVLPLENAPHRYIFWCPGCRCAHHIDDRMWEFDHNMEKPTIRPSILVHKSEVQPRCHIFVRAGKIQYLNDCEHELAGQIVDMTPPP